ncbi:MAG: S1 RNA-binding domain-containing protein, partial [Clostridia bacterium]|nr:S1 RNA-binding domain-containing protein [Clostridia bacterium]
PIRRLSDLATHRMIKAVLLDGAERKYKGYAAHAAEAASECELRALEAEREIEALYKTSYMAKHVGEEFDATVSGCTSFGIFAELANTCEGLIPFEFFEEDVYFDEAHLSVRVGEEIFTVGTPLRIRVEEADISRRRVSFSLVTKG